MNKSNATWMSKHEQHIATKQLFRLALPGASEAGTYAIDLMSNWSGEEPFWGKLFKCYTVQYARTQTLDLYDQAVRGVRYFDLRVAVHNGEFVFKSSNGLVGGNVGRAFGDLCLFAKQHRLELLVVHVSDASSLSENQHRELRTMLERRAGNRLAQVDKFGPESTVRSFWDADKNIVVVYPVLDNRSHLWPARRICCNVRCNSTERRGDDDWRVETVVKASVENTRPGLRIVTVVPSISRLHAVLHPWASAQSIAGEFNAVVVQPATRPGLNCMAMNGVAQSQALVDNIISLNRTHSVLAGEYIDLN